VLTDDPELTALNLFVKAHPDRFFSPSANILAFNPAIVPSSYYLSPMFRLFQFFSDSKWNRLNMITPGLFGSIKGSFMGGAAPDDGAHRREVPGRAGTYRMLLRGVATVNDIAITAKTLGYEQDVELRARPKFLDFYDQREVFSSKRQPLDVSQYSVDELERMIPTNVVAVNNRYQFIDLGTVEVAKPGTHTFYLNKRDSNPLLIEGILVIPEETYQTMAIPENVRVVSSVKDLGMQRAGHERRQVK
jgi:hypothetical protein